MDWKTFNSTSSFNRSIITKYLDFIRFILEIICQKKGFGTPWIALYALNNAITYFDSFRVEQIPKEI